MLIRDSEWRQTIKGSVGFLNTRVQNPVFSFHNSTLTSIVHLLTAVLKHVCFVRLEGFTLAGFTWRNKKAKVLASEALQINFYTNQWEINKHTVRSWLNTLWLWAGSHSICLCAQVESVVLYCDYSVRGDPILCICVIVLSSVRFVWGRNGSINIWSQQDMAYLPIVSRGESLLLLL